MEFLRKKEIKITSYVVLGVFLVVGLSFYRLVLLINNKINDKKKDVCDRIIDIVKAEIQEGIWI